MINLAHIYVKAFPDAPRESVSETTPGHLRIFVCEPAQNNRANKRVHTLAAEFYNIPANKIRMIKGHRGNSKIFEVIT